MALRYLQSSVVWKFNEIRYGPSFPPKILGNLKASVLLIMITNTPFTNTSPNYPRIISIKIAFTNSELPKIIRTLFTSAH